MRRRPVPAIDFRNALSTPLGAITRAGFARHETVCVPRWRRLDEYALVYLHEGEGVYFDANGVSQTLTPGDLIVVFPGLAHRYFPKPGTEWVSTHICFQGAVFDLWRTQGLLDPRSPVYHLEPVAEWSRRLEAVFSAPRRAGYAPPLHDLCRLQQVLAEIVTGAGRAAEYEADLRWLSRACSLIEAELGGPPNWEKIARPLGLTVDGFRKRFARLSHQPPGRYRMSRLIDRACELMQAGIMNDRQIAETLGFCDAQYFSRRFREIAGRSPRAFRRGLSR